MTEPNISEPTSLEARALVSEFEATVARTGQALVEAEHSLALEVRRALLSHEHERADTARDAVAAARTKHESATARLVGARELFQEALERERMEQLDELRAPTPTDPRCAAGSRSWPTQRR